MDAPLPYFPNAQAYSDLLSLIQQHFPEDYREWPRTYDEWLELDNQERSKQESQGQKIQRIAVVPDEFIQFCADDRLTAIPHNLGRWAQHVVGVRAEMQHKLEEEADYDPLLSVD